MLKAGREGVFLGLLALGLMGSGCGMPIGIEYRELYISRIVAPERTPSGQPVQVTLINPVTPRGEAGVVVQTDDAKREITFVVTEHEVQELFVIKMSPAMVFDRELSATFTPKGRGTYLLKTRGGAATATVEVE